MTGDSASTPAIASSAGRPAVGASGSSPIRGRPAYRLKGWGLFDESIAQRVRRMLSGECFVASWYARISWISGAVSGTCGSPAPDRRSALMSA